MEALDQRGLVGTLGGELMMSAPKPAESRPAELRPAATNAAGAPADASVSPAWFLPTLLVVTAAVWATGLDGPFIYDDLPHIEENPGIRDLSNLRAVLQSGYQETRPLYMLSVALCYRLAGNEPLLHHAVNVGLHLANVWLLYRLSQRFWTDQGQPSLLPAGWGAPELSAALFAVHPLCTEAVTYINSRSGLMAACFGLSMMHAYFRFRECSTSRRFAYYFVAVVAYVMALLSKESAVVFPVLLAVWVLGFRRAPRSSKLRDALWTLPLFACTAVLPVLFALVSNPHDQTIGVEFIPLPHYWMTQVCVVAFFARLCVLPLDHNIDYDFPITSSPLEPRFLLSLIVLTGLGWGALSLRCKAPFLAFGIVWFFVGLAPTNSVVPFVDFIAERHMYFGLMGACWALGALGASAGAWFPGVSRFAVRGACIAVLAVLCLLTVLRNRVLATPAQLWEQTVARSPNKARPNLNYGIYLMRQGSAEAGAAHLLRANALAPSDPETHFNLGVLADQAADAEAAAAHFEAALRLRPIRRYADHAARMRLQIGTRYYEHAEYDLAAAHFRRALAFSPSYVPAHFNLGMALLKAGNPRAAIREFKKTLELDPAHPRAASRLAEASRSQPGSADP